MIRVVFDTNVLVSAMLKPKGNEARLVFGVPDNLIVPCATESIFAEYRRVLSASKFRFPLDKIDETLSALRGCARFFDTSESPYQSPYPTDTKFLQCAFAASADFLVTGNMRHFPSCPYGSTQVVNAPELLTQLNQDLT